MKICNNSAESTFTITLLNGSRSLEATLKPGERIVAEERLPVMSRYVQLSVKCGDQTILPNRYIEQNTYVGLLGRGSPHVHISFDTDESADAKTPTTEMVVLVAKKVYDFFDLSRGQLLDKDWATHNGRTRLGLFYKHELAPLVRDCMMRYEQLQAIQNALEASGLSELFTKDKPPMNKAITNSTSSAALHALHSTDFTRTPTVSNIAYALSKEIPNVQLSGAYKAKTLAASAKSTTVVDKESLPSTDKAGTPAASANSTSVMGKESLPSTGTASLFSTIDENEDVYN